MSFEGEFASYKPLRRILENDKVKQIQQRLHIRDTSRDSAEIYAKFTEIKSDNQLLPDYVLAIDGSYATAKAEVGFPGAELGYVTVASVLIDLAKVRNLQTHDFINPVSARQTEKATSLDGVFPGCNLILDDEEDPKSSLRKAIYESLEQARIFEDSESLLDTYEHLFRIKQEVFPTDRRPNSPIADVDEDMIYGYGIYSCPSSGKRLYSTDALRIHELFKEAGSNDETFSQIMSTVEKLWLVHVLRSFERKGWLSILQRIAFVVDGPLAVFSTSSWLTYSIQHEINRINEAQKSGSGIDMMIVGLEKSGTFCAHFDLIDTPDSQTGHSRIDKESVLLLTDRYIKEKIIFSQSSKPYGKDTYFGRKILFKSSHSAKLVPVIMSYNTYQKDIKTASLDQYPRLPDILATLDQLVSNRHPNSISPLISAHAEASIPLNLGKKIFEEIASEVPR